MKCKDIHKLPISVFEAPDSQWKVHNRKFFREMWARHSFLLRHSFLSHVAQNFRYVSTKTRWGIHNNNNFHLAIFLIVWWTLVNAILSINILLYIATTRTPDQIKRKVSCLKDYELLWCLLCNPQTAWALWVHNVTHYLCALIVSAMFPLTAFGGGGGAGAR